MTHEPDAVPRHSARRRQRLASWLPWLGLFCLAVAGLTPAHAETTTYIVSNAQGTVVATMDRDGNVTYTADYRPYYRPYGKQDPGTARPGPGYTGHVNDPATGLVYMQQRYYDPAIGRFISPDPIAPKPGNIFNFGRYTYANNNPIVNTDPDGRNPMSSPFQDVDGDCTSRFGCPYALATDTHQTSNEVLGQTVTITYYNNVDSPTRNKTNIKLTAAMDLLNASKSKLGPAIVYLVHLVNFVDVTANAHDRLGVIGPHRVLFSTNQINSPLTSIAWLASLFPHEGAHIYNRGLPKGLRLPRWMGERNAIENQILIGKKIGLTAGEIQYLKGLENNTKYLKIHMSNGFSM